MKYHGRGGPWLRRGLWREASETTDGEYNSARARPCGDSRGTGTTRTHRECHGNRGRLLQPWRVCPWASAFSQGRDTGPAHRVFPVRCAGFARPIPWVPNCHRASLRDSVTAEIGDATVPVGPLELQIAYKLYLATQTDFEDALHLYTVFEESLRAARLEDWVRRLGVQEEYDRLERT